jgi:hypothetical protein
VATFQKIQQALVDKYHPVTMYNGELFRFEVEQTNGSRMYFSGRHRIFEVRLAQVKIVDHYKWLDNIKEGEVFLIAPTQENKLVIFDKKFQYLKDRH